MSTCGGSFPFGVLPPVLPMLRLHDCNRRVTRVTDEPIRLHGYTNAENRLQPHVTGKAKPTEGLSPSGYTVTRLHEVEQLSRNGQSDGMPVSRAVAELGQEAADRLC